MEFIKILLLLVVLVSSIASMTKYYSRKTDSRRALRRLLENNEPARRLTSQEHTAISEAFKKARPADEDVYRLTGRISRHGVSTSGDTNWCLLVGGVEIRPFPHWALLQQEINEVEIVKPRRGKVGIPVAFNGVTLADAHADNLPEELQAHVSLGSPAGDSEEAEDADTEPTAEFRGSRPETREEGVLRRIHSSNNAGRALFFCIGLAGLLITSRWQQPLQLLAIPSALLALWNGWRLLRYWKMPSPPRKQAEIRSFRGPLSAAIKQIGSDQDPTLTTAIYMGDTELTYPVHWWHHIKADPSGNHELDVDDDGNVVRHDRLDLYEERRHHPAPPWGKHVILLAGGLIILFLAHSALGTYGSVTNTLHLISSRFQSRPERIEADDPEAFHAAAPGSGDWIDITGHAQCLAEPGELPADAIEEVMNERSLNCTLLGWTENRAEEPMVDLSGMNGLMALAERVRPVRGSSGFGNRRANYRDAIKQAVGYLILEPNERVLELEAFCDTTDTDCTDAKRRLAQATSSRYQSNWDEALANAREGDLEHDISLERAEAAGLHTALVNVLRERMFHLMTSALEETLRAHPAPVLLHAIGDAFSLPPDSNAG